MTEFAPTQLALDHTAAGNVFLGNGRFDAAIQAYEAALQNDPGHLPAQINMGTALAATGDLDGAIARYQAVLQIQPDYVQAHSNMGLALHEKGAFDLAIACYQAALKIRPDFIDAHSHMGNALLDKGQVDAAIDSYQAALRLDADYPAAHNNLGNALRRRGDLDAAIAHYSKAISAQPVNAEFYNNMGVALLEKGDADAATECYHKALAFFPDFAEAHTNLGDALRRQGDNDGAITCYKRALEIRPDFAEAQHILATLQGETPNAPPRAYVETLFDQYAEKFENALVQNLDYQTPKTLVSLIAAHNNSGALGSVLDLGCGTGLAGVELRAACNNLVGIDLSTAMLKHARDKAIYDALIHSDIIDYLQTADLAFDYIIATDVFVYVGDLSEVFRLLKLRNGGGGTLVFSTEHSDSDGFKLEPSGRYSHSERYIRGLAAQYGYEIAHFANGKLRKENGAYLIGGYYILTF